MILTLDATNRITFVMINLGGTEVAGLGSGFTLQVSKNGGAWAASAGTKAEIGSGWYSYIFTAGECDTEGPISVKVTGAGAVQQNLAYQVGATGIWSSPIRTLTMSADAIIAALEGDALTVRRGDTLSLSITGLGDISGRSKLWFAVKSDARQDTDAQALLFVEETAGLTVLNAAVHTTTTDGTITVDDAVAGNITITIKPAATASLNPDANLYASVEMLTGAGIVQTLVAYDRRVTISADVVRAIS
jgi:hypothetical protein